MDRKCILDTDEKVKKKKKEGINKLYVFLKTITLPFEGQVIQYKGKIKAGKHEEKIKNLKKTGQYQKRAIIKRVTVPEIEVACDSSRNEYLSTKRHIR